MSYYHWDLISFPPCLDIILQASKSADHFAMPISSPSFFDMHPSFPAGWVQFQRKPLTLYMGEYGCSCRENLSPLTWVNMGAVAEKTSHP